MNQLRWSASRRTSREAPVAFKLSSDELRVALLRAGARLVAAHAHGDFLEIRRHLVFVRRTPIVTGLELHDALRAAAIAPEHLHELLGRPALG
jgi:hypothetical protein